MDSKEFKNLFGEMATANGFGKAFGGWLKESSECIAVLDLQKSNFGNYYQLIMKVFVQGVFGKTYIKSKDLVKKDVGHIRNGEPQEYKDVFDFDRQVEDLKRKERLEKLFQNHIVPFTDKALSRLGIRELANKGEILLLPAVKQELEV
jgi:hypothetical protein